jgi:hypothetical protein
MRYRVLLAGMIFATAAHAAGDMDGMPGMDMSAMPMAGVLGPYPMTREASGTSWQPDAAAHQGLHATLGGWELMGHALLNGVFDSQSGPRGATQWFVSGMFMGAARRELGEGDVLNLRLMLSPDAFMGDRGYALLLASGETADGKTPLIDRQHPHDLVMEMAASYSHALTAADGVFVYGGYPGEPALGPPAFPHRASAMDIPEAPITHHWLDSTHIAFGVATLGYVHDDWKVEVSQFTGREPDRQRFDFDAARFDSTSARLSWNPDTNWSLQVSWGFLKSPEQLTPALNETRTTASAQYVLPLDGGGSLAATAAWGHKQTSDGEGLDGFSLEAEYKPDRIWTIFARAESAGNGELVPPDVATVGKISVGAIHDWPAGEHAAFGLGVLYDFDFAPSVYGSDPHGAMVFVRLRAG